MVWEYIKSWVQYWMSDSLEELRRKKRILMLAEEQLEAEYQSFDVLVKNLEFFIRRYKKLLKEKSRISRKYVRLCRVYGVEPESISAFDLEGEFSSSSEEESEELTPEIKEYLKEFPKIIESIDVKLDTFSLNIDNLRQKIDELQTTKLWTQSNTEKLREEIQIASAYYRNQRQGILLQHEVFDINDSTTENGIDAIH